MWAFKTLYGGEIEELGLYSANWLTKAKMLGSNDSHAISTIN